MKTAFKLSLLLFLFIETGCQKSGTAGPGTPTKPDTLVAVHKGFEKTPQEINLSQADIHEGSGIADSKKNPGFVWIEEDSGNPARLWLVGHDGEVTKTISLENAVNRDWEDVVLAKGPDDTKNYLYIGDTGDNDEEHDNYTYYRFEEPLMSATTVSDYDKIVFEYPDGSHDSEAFMVDGNTKDIYIITKRDDKSKVYKLAYPQSSTSTNTAEYIMDLPYNGVVSAALSDDGTEIIVKTYPTLHYYTKPKTGSIEDALKTDFTTLDYQLEAQGEGVCFSADNKGFYTFSEETDNIIPTLNYYKRKD
ncbi:MAG: hypothetical protein ABI415_04935 [Flavitalea sp.]